jgi:hypothetical protein
MENQEFKRRTFLSSTRMEEMIKELQDKTGTRNVSAIIQRAIHEFHNSEFPAYARRNSTPEDQGERAVARKEARRQAERDGQEMICLSLGGEIVSTGSGAVCRYKTFSKFGEFDQELPVDHLSEDLITQQFFPDRMTIENLVAEGKLKATLPVKK